MLFHWKVPSFDTWRGSGLLTCKFTPWDRSAHPARQFCERWYSMLRTRIIQISWPPGKSSAQHSRALSLWFHAELTSSVACESHRPAPMNPSGDPHWCLCTALPCTMWKYRCVQICFRPPGIIIHHVVLKRPMSAIWKCLSPVLQHHLNYQYEGIQPSVRGPVCLHFTWESWYKSFWSH